jgi:hypothetical protein
MMNRINSIYITGYEYNRLLQDTPFESRTSALAGNVLWTGGAPLWLFENVYCTTDSLRAEQATAEIMGWATSRIFSFLHDAGILFPIDWSSPPQISDPTRQELVQRFNELRGVDVRSLIARGDHNRLENLKLNLLSPLQKDLGCWIATSPNVLRTWFRQADLGVAVDGPSSTPSALIPLAERLQRLGLTLCGAPGETGVTPADLARQRNVQDTIEREMIVELTAGDGAFSGPEGFVPYLERLTPHRAVYEPINSQLWNDWQANWPQLRQIRALAKYQLWPALHGEWLPRLIEDEAFAPDFSALLGAALLQEPFRSFLDLPSRITIALVSAATVTLTAVTTPSPVVAAAVGGVSAVAAETAVHAMQRRQHSDVRAQSEPIRAFVQDARRRLRAAGNR